MRSLSAEAVVPVTSRLKKLSLSLVFFLGGMAHELRNPIQCQCVNPRAAASWRAPERKKS